MTDTPAHRVRIAIVDDHELLLDSLANWFTNSAPDFEVALCAAGWHDLVHSPEFPTDLVLLDLQLREPVSIEARVRTCRAAGAKVILLTGSDDEQALERALAAGAAAVMQKSRPMHEVLQAARRVMGLHEGEVPERSWRPTPSDAAEAVERPKLSQSERMALKLYASGHTTLSVAENMNVSYETAKTFLRRVREKYAKVNRPAGTKVDLIRRAAEDGYLD